MSPPLYLRPSPPFPIKPVSYPVVPAVSLCPLAPPPEPFLPIPQDKPTYLSTCPSDDLPTSLLSCAP